jgi:hypothetical protein
MPAKNPGFANLSQVEDNPPAALTHEHANSPPATATTLGLFGGLAQSPPKSGLIDLTPDTTFSSEAPVREGFAPNTPQELMFFLLLQQSFDGTWNSGPHLLKALDIEKSVLESEFARLDVDERLYTTQLVIAYFEERFGDDEDTWELVVEKAKAWLSEQKISNMEDLIKSATALVKK